MTDKNRSPCRAPLLEFAPTHTLERLSEHLTRTPMEVYTEKDAKGQDVTMVRVDVATVDIINLNGRYYSRAVYEAANAAAQDDLKSGALWGLLEHPSDNWDDPHPARGKLENISLLYKSIAIEGDTVVARAQIVETSSGQDLKALLKAGVQVGISTNGTGSTTYAKAKELFPDHPEPDWMIAVIGADYRYLSIDAVSTPSNRGGKATKENITMKKNLQKVLERLSMTEAAFKAQHPEWHSELMAESDAPTPAPTPVSTPTSAQVASATESTLERSVLSLTARLEASERGQLEERRRNIAMTALEGASLPKAPKVGDLDLDARFREQLEAASLGASEDGAAKSTVDGMIAERRALLGLNKAPIDKTRSSGVSLPSGNLESLQGSAKSSGTEVKNIRGQLGL